MKICAYDFDNTLVPQNSLLGFVMFVISKNNNALLRGVRFAQVKLTLKYISRVRNASKTPYLVKQLKGITRAELEHLGEKYAQDNVRFEKKIINELNEDIGSGYEPYIISGSIHEIIAPCASILGVKNIFCSTLKYENNICLGVLDTDIRGGKDLIVDGIVKENLKINIRKSKFVSDNIEDIQCAAKFGIVVGVASKSDEIKEWSKIATKIIAPDRGIKLTPMHIFMPSYYYLSVRANWIELILQRILFPAFIVFVSSTSGNAWLVFLSWLSFILLYEIGYIDNDYNAVRKEANPSIRLSSDQRQHDVVIFIIARLFYFTFAAYALFSLYRFNDAVLVTGFAFANLLVYAFHNRLTQKMRIITYPILKASHLYIPVLLVAPHIELAIGIVLFYLPQTIIAYGRKVGAIRNYSIRALNLSLLFIQLLILVAFYMYVLSHNIRTMNIFLILFTTTVLTLSLPRIKRLLISRRC